MWISGYPYTTMACPVRNTPLSLCWLILIFVVEILQKTSLVVLAKGYIFAIFQEYAPLSVAVYALEIHNIGAVYAQEVILR